MQEYRIEDDSSTIRGEAIGRLLSWGTVALLVVIAVLLFTTSRLDVSEGNLSLSGELLFVLSILGAIVGASVLICREALHLAARKLVFVVNGNGIVRKRLGYPDIRISFPEIETLSEGQRWLVIKSAEPRRTIAIPINVRGYDALRSELASHHPVEWQARFPWKSAALLSVSLLSWAIILWSQSVGTAIAASVIALIALASASYRLWKVLHGSRRWLLSVSIGIAWLIACLLICIRVVSLW